MSRESHSRSALPHAMLKCPQGHHWEPEAPAPEGRPGDVCPLCGSAAAGPAPTPEDWSTAGKAWMIWFLVLGGLTLAGAFITLALNIDLGILWVLLGAGLAWFVSLMAWATWYSERRRMFAMRDACQAMSFTFIERASKEQLAALSLCPLFKRGHSHGMRHLMQGRVGETDLLIVDYRYTVGHGKNQHTHVQTVVILPEGGTHLPHFTLYPENFFHKIGELFGFKDIDFAENLSFSRRYRLKGPNEMAIRRTFTPETLGYFADNPGWSVEVQDGQFIVYLSSKRCKPDNAPQRVAEALTIHALFTVAE